MERLQNLFKDMKIGDQLNPANFFIQGGYYETKYGVDEFSENSLKAAIELGSIIKNANKQNTVSYGILVNNMQQVCGDTVCLTPDEFKTDAKVAEQEIYELIKKLNLHDYDFTISNERSIKNKGLRMMKRLLKQGSSLLFKRDSTCWCMPSKLGGDISLFEMHSDRLVAKCPTIMGTYYSEMIKKVEEYNPSSTLPVVIIDFCSYNDKDKVVRGLEVTFGLLNKNFNPNKTYHIMPVLSDMACNNIWLMKFFLNSEIKA